jgi:cyclophilin family peptidyl-prolyl cis-trans isomerase
LPDASNPVITVNKLKYILLACLAAGFFLPTDLDAATSSNTLVRFQLRYGLKLFGNVDVELFDHDKPATVSNFLNYVRSEAFNHTFMDNVIPGRVIKGGQYRVENPYANAFLEKVESIPEDPAITNEFNVTRVIPNTFGTIAMALDYADFTNSIPTNIVTYVTNGMEVVTNILATNYTVVVNHTVLDSGTTTWFFNTGDNSAGSGADFDSQGFVVFGRVVGGSKYLTYFNTISEDDGVLNMNGENFLFSTCDFPIDEDTNELAFVSLPVAFFAITQGFLCPYYSDLFNVSVSVLKSTTDGNDTASPKLKISYPLKSTVLTNDHLIARGTASDAVQLDSVLVYLNANEAVTATVVSNTWSAPLVDLPAGTNTISVEATDAAGNRVIATTSFFFKVELPFTLLEPNGTGTGRTFGLTNQQMLIIDKTYSVTAKADPGNFFLGWQNSNNIVSQNERLLFIMRTNTTVNAKFDTNFFPLVKGLYNGLFVNSTEVDPAGSGYFTMNLTDSGSYSAKLLLNGKTLPFSGGFSSSMSNGFPFFSPVGMPGLTILRMGFDIISLEDHLVGSLTNFYARQSPTNTSVIITNTWSANLLADRVQKYTGTNRAPNAGKYTMIFPADTNSAADPAYPSGDGYGTVTVSPAGGVAFSGALADGTKVTQKTYVSKDGHWPLYLTPLKTNAALISWIHFTNEPASDFSGLFNWFKYRHATTYYSNGFAAEATLVGSRFTTPNTTNQMLFLTNGILGFTNGNLAADFANNVLLDPKGKVTSTNANKLSATLTSGNGLMTGSVTPPGATKAIPFKGVVLQKQTNAAGFFLGTNESGRVYLGP